jgi:hypothetical protein
MPDIQIANPAGERFTIDASELEAAKAKGYAPASDGAAPSAPVAPSAPQTPAQVQAPTAVSDADLTPDGLIRAFDKSGQEFHVEGHSLSDIQAIRDKGYTLASDRALDARTAATAQAAEAEKQAKLGIEGYSPEALKEDYAKRGITGLGSGPLDVAAAAVAAPFQPLTDALRNRLPGGRTPEQQEAVEAARSAEEAKHPAVYWSARIPSEIAGALGAGEAAKALTATTRIAKLGTAAKLAIEGAVYAAPEAAANAINGDAAHAAESLALGVGGNIGLHAIFSLGGKAVGALASRAEQAAPEAISAAQDVIADKLGIKPEVVDKIRLQIAPMLEEAGVKDSTKLGDAIEKINDLKSTRVEAEKAIGALDKFDGKTATVSDALTKISEDLGAVDKLGQLGKVQEYVGELLRDPEVGFADAHKLKAFVEDPAVLQGVSDQVRHDAIGIVRQNLLAAEDKAATEIGGSKILEGLKKERALSAFNMILDHVSAEPGSAKAMGLPIKEIAQILARGATRRLPEWSVVHMAASMMGWGPVSVAAHAGIKGAQVFGKLRGLAYEGNAFGDAVKVAKGSTTPNTSLALDAMKAMESSIATKAKELLASLGARESVTHRANIEASIGRFIPGGGVGQTREHQITVLRRAVSQYEAHPEQVADHLAAVTAPLRNEGLGPVADAYTEHQIRLMKVIQSVMPVDQSMGQAHPFAASSVDPGVSPSVKARYERVLTLAADPTSLLGLVKSNTISPYDVAIAAATNPSALQKMRMALVDEAMKSKPDLTYQQRLSMGILMGTDLDEKSRATTATLQSTFNSPGNAALGPKHGVQNSGNHPKGQDRALQSFLTGSQKALVNGS